MSPKRIYRDNPILARIKGLSSSDLKKLARTTGIDPLKLQKVGLGEVDLSKPELEKISKALGG